MLIHVHILQFDIDYMTRNYKHIYIDLSSDQMFCEINKVHVLRQAHTIRLGHLDRLAYLVCSLVCVVH